MSLSFPSAEPEFADSNGERTRDRDARKLEREARRAAEANGPLDPGQRFRALQATFRMETDYMDLADKKARFALIIMSVLNAVPLVVVARGGAELVPRDGLWAFVIRTELVVYAAITVYYIGQAIESLRPRGKIGRPTGDLPTEIVPGRSMRMLFHTDIAARSRELNQTLWGEVRLDNLNAELADQVHMVSCINVKKFNALGRLYFGVAVMTALITVTLLTIGAHYFWVG
jgi:hypothetical protein